MLCNHLEAAAKAGAVVDLQDLLLRCTLDSFGRLAMGTHFGCIQVEGKVVDGRYVLPTVAFMESFDYLNALVAGRFPRIGWAYLEQLDGTKEKIKAAQKTMSDVAFKVISEKRAKMAKGEEIPDDEKGEGSSKGHADMWVRVEGGERVL